MRVKSNVNGLKLALSSHSSFVIINEFLELNFIREVQFGKAKKPFVNVHRMLVTDGRSLQEIISVFLSFGLSNVFLDIFVKSHCLMQIDGLLIIKVNIVEDLFQFCLLVLTQLSECFLLGNQSAT